MISYVYLDVLFFVNLIVNYIMLLAAGKITGDSFQTKRAVIASCIGGLYSLSALVLPFKFCFSFIARIAFGIFMVTFTYPKAHGLSSLVLVGSFYMCSTMVAGTAMALYIQGKSIAKWWSLVLAIILICVAEFLWKILNISAIYRNDLVKLEIILGTQSVAVSGMVDTGNSLRDPVSGLPVVVVDWNSLKSIIPLEASQFFLSTWDFTTDNLSESPIATKLKIIPYMSVSGNSEIMPAFIPDGLFFIDENDKYKKDAVVGVSSKPFKPHGIYQALLHPELVKL